MPEAPAFPDPGGDDDSRPVPPWPDWMDDPAYLALRAEDDDLELYEAPGSDPPDVDEDELAGAIAGWDRMRAYDSARMHAAVAELARRRPAAGCALKGPAQLPEAVDEFLPRELGSILAETSTAAGDMLSLAQELEINLPGTKAAFRDGILSQRKAAIIASATALLDAAEARAAEAMVLDGPGR
jgi:hypothetical protein